MGSRELDVSRHVLGRFELVALLDAVGVFPLPVDEAFGAPRASDRDEARRLDPGAEGPDGTWRLAFRATRCTVRTAA